MKIALKSRKKSFVVIVFCALISVVFASLAFADQVVLQNGDTLTGEVVNLEAGVLQLKTEYSKPVNIKVGKIKSISTENIVEVHLADGQILKGKLSSDDQGNLLLTSDIGVFAILAWKDVESMNPPPVKWTGNVSVGATIESGNTDRVSAAAGAEANRKTKRDEFSMKALYNYAEEEEIITTRNAYGALKYRYLFYKSFYAYVAAEVYSDEFQDLKLRTIIGPGLGYQVWDDKVKKLLFEAGAVYVNEDYDLTEDDEHIDGRGATSFAYTLSDTVKFSDDFVYYHTFEDDTYQIRNEAAITSALSAKFALRLANILLYDSEPVPGITDTDMIYIASLQYTF